MQGSDKRAAPILRTTTVVREQRPLVERKRKARCKKSPTGAHRVVLGRVQQDVTKGVCRYCGLKRRYSASEDGFNWEV